MARHRATYSGRVRVALVRAASWEITQRHGVAGYAPSRPDGTVALEVEGPPDKVVASLAAVAQAYTGCVLVTPATGYVGLARLVKLRRHPSLGWAGAVGVFGGLHPASLAGARP